MADDVATADTTKSATASAAAAPVIPAASVAPVKPAVGTGPAAGGDSVAARPPPPQVIDPPEPFAATDGHLADPKAYNLAFKDAAPERLRAFEDATMGPNAPRINGAVERGHGSLYSRMTDPQKAEHAGLEKLVGAEQKLAEAHAALIQAEADHEAALAAAEPAAASNG